MADDAAERAGLQLAVGAAGGEVPAPAIQDPEPDPGGSCIGKFHDKLYFRTLDRGQSVQGRKGAAAPLSTIERQPFTDLSTSRAPCQPWNSSSTARRGRKPPFRLLSPRRAHAKAPEREDLL